MSALIGLLAFITILLLVESLKRLTAPGMGEQLTRYALGETVTGRQSSFDKHVRPSIPILTRRFGFLRGLTNPAQIERQLVYAGRPLNLNAEQFFGLQLFVALTALAVGIVYFFYSFLLGLCGGPLVPIVAPIAGFFWPRMWLNGKVKRRQQAITLALPDLLDMLSISVQAGMGFDQALQHVAQRMSGPIQEEITHLLRELNMGEPRDRTFRRLVERNTSEDLRLFVDALLQAEELGTPVSRILAIQAEEVRVRRVQRAKELAGQASPKISMVTVFLVAPSALCLLLMALVLSLMGDEGLGSPGVNNPASAPIAPIATPAESP